MYAVAYNRIDSVITSRSNHVEEPCAQQLTSSFDLDLWFPTGVPMDPQGSAN